MAAPSLVLFSLHHSLEPQGFENLCVDLLVREGYSRIIPGGKSRDHGRDAEVRYWIEANHGNPQIAFQFSKEAEWESKLRSDIAKITRKCRSIDRVVFVSSRSITVEKQDKLREELKASHQIVLEILDEGWFRIRLEEDHVDLARKHLGVVIEPTPAFHATRIKLHGLTDENKEEMLRYRSPEELRAILAAQTRSDPTNSGAWKGLAHVEYYLHDYEAALLTTSKALKYSHSEVERWNLIALKASIIAEQGIASGSRLLLKKAKELFKPFIDHFGRSIDHYNLANIYGALKQNDAAELHYRRCLEIDATYAQAWKNLGSLLVNMGRLDEGMHCLDLALELKPDLLEALCTKANVLIMSSDSCDEALKLMNRAFEIDPDLERHWPHAHYWQALALCREERLPEALGIVEDRLERKFDCPYLGRIANDILAKLWRSDPSYIGKAEQFFALRIDSESRDYRALVEMLDILDSSNRQDEAWRLLGNFLGTEAISVRAIAERVPLSLSDLTDSFASEEYYRRFRSMSSLADYAHILDKCGLRPHDEVPEVLFHLLLPAYSRLASVFQESFRETEAELDVILDTYRLISRIFAAFGGFLLSPNVPETLGKRTELLAGAVVAAFDIPLMELSRLIGFLNGVVGRDVPESYQKSVVEVTSSVHENWLIAFLEAIETDWGIEALNK